MTDDTARTVALTRLQQHLGVPLVDLPAVQLRQLADVQAAGMVAYTLADEPRPGNGERHD